MLRSRITAAAVGAAVLGVTAGLVPTVSSANSYAVLPPVVTWADGPEDFTHLDDTSGSLTLPEGWSWSGTDLTTGDLSDALDEVADFGPDGVTAKDDTALILAHTSGNLVWPDLLPDVVSEASASVGGNGAIGLLIADAADPTTLVTTAFALDGLQGRDTAWAYTDSGEESTDELAADLRDDQRVVIGTFVGLVGGGFVDVEPEPDEPGTEPDAGPGTDATAAPTAEPTAGPTADPTADAATPAPLDDTLQRFLPQVPQGAEGAMASRATANPADAGIASLRFAETTTYFTPQPVASASVDGDTPLGQTRTGFQVYGAGFAPVETVAVTIEQDGRTFASRKNASVSDDEGDVVVVVTLPEGSVHAGAYTATVTGTASGQTATVTAAFRGDAVAPVATPVPGRATFTG